MLKRVSRYLFFQVSQTALSLLCILLVSLWLVHSLKFIDLILKSRESFSTFFKLSFLAIPDLLTILLPFAVVLAVMTVYTRLRNDNELTVFFACGYNPWSLAKPAILVGCLGTVLVYFINIFVLHSSFREMRDVEHRLRNALPNIMLKQGVFNSFGSLTMYVHRKRGKHHLEGIVAYDQKAGEPAYTILAREGNFFIENGKPTLVLKDGNRQTKNNDGVLSIVYFEETIVDLSESSKAVIERPKKPYELSLEELISGTRGSENLTDRQRLVAEAFQRFLTPWYSVVFVSVVLAVLFAQRMRRTRSLNPLFIGSALVLFLQVFCLFLNHWGSKQWQALFVSFFLLLGSLIGSLGVLWFQSFGLTRREGRY